MAIDVSHHHRIVTLPLYNKVVITSPGYPYTYYERNINYTWDVRAHEDTEEIFMNITIDIDHFPGFSCVDYLLVCIS